MKKFLALILASVMILGSMLAFTSCKEKAPALNYDDAKEALEDAGYSFYEDEEESEDPVYEAKLQAFRHEDEESDRLEIYWFENEAVAKLYYKGIKMEKEQQIEQIEFEIKFLKKCKKEHKNDYRSTEMEELDDEIKELKNELKIIKNDKEVSFGIDGNVVWKGTNTAIEDSRG